MAGASEICLVTGASRGIGAAVVRRLAAPHRRVFLNHRDSSQAALALQRGAADAGGHVEIVQGDVAVVDDARSMVARAAAATGRLDVLVHCASAPLVPKRVIDLDWPTDVEPHMAVAVRGFLNCVQAASSVLQPGARIVVLLSDALFHTPPAQMGAYLIAKGALWGVTRAVAKELQSRQVRVYAVSPSMADTELLKAYGERTLEIIAAQHPTGRLAAPEEVAAVVGMLVEEAGSYMHGTNTIVNGGLAF